MLIIQIGIMGGWSSPTLEKLLRGDASFTISPVEASWVASLVNLGRLLGAVIAAVSANLLGSKRTITMTLFPLAGGWLLIILANDVNWLYVSRLCSGVGLGMGYCVFPLYIGEVSMPEIRGALVSLASCGAPFGQVLASVCGMYLSIDEAASIYLAMTIALIIMFFCLPESPHHLMKIGQHEAARKSINWYRSSREVENEVAAVEKFVATNASQTFADKFKEFGTPPIRKATFQIMALYTFMQSCGLNSILFYMETILRRGHFTLISAGELVIYVNICGVFASAISISIIDRFGRRFLLLISSIGVTMFMIGLMTHFFLIDMNIDVTSFQWLPMISMFGFIIFFFFGLMPVPSAVLSETFPASIKHIAACIASLTGAVFAFTSSKTYQPMIDIMGEKYVFLFYATCSVIVIPYILFVMPETKGKSLQQIQDELMAKK